MTPMTDPAARSTLRRFRQMAYVTNDIDAAIERFAQTAGVSRFLSLRDFCNIDAYGHESLSHIALANVGDHQIELIQPLNRDFGFYSDPLPDLDGANGLALHFHHVGMPVETREDFDRLFAQHEARGLKIPSHGAFNDLLWFMYVDTQAQLGHHLEYVYFTEAAQALYANVPDNA
jgi:hypothetical protein